jgi:hypothetical protein
MVHSAGAAASPRTYSAGLRVGLGSGSFEAGPENIESYDSKDVHAQLNLEAPSLNVALSVFFEQKMFQDKSINFNVSLLGVGLAYYPLGLAMFTVFGDDGVSISQSRMAPYLAAHLATGQFSLTWVEKGLSPNILILNYRLTAGFEMPLGRTWSIVPVFFLEGPLVKVENQFYSGTGFALGITLRP